MQTNRSGLIVEMFMLDGVYDYEILEPLLNMTVNSKCAELRLTGDTGMFDSGLDIYGREKYLPTIFRSVPIRIYPGGPEECGQVGGSHRDARGPLNRMTKSERLRAARDASPKNAW